MAVLLKMEVSHLINLNLNNRTHNLLHLPMDHPRWQLVSRFPIFSNITENPGLKERDQTGFWTMTPLAKLPP
jgi:hypothetical protein